MKEGSGTGAKVLQSMGLDYNSLKLATYEIVSRKYGNKFKFNIYAEDQQGFLSLHMKLQRKMSEYIGTEHILFRNYKEGQGIALLVLRRLGIEAELLKTP